MGRICGSSRRVFGEDHALLADLLKEFPVFSGIAQVRTGTDKGDGPQAVLDRGSMGVSIYPLSAAADDDRARVIFSDAFYAVNTLFFVFPRAASGPDDCDSPVWAVDQGFIFPPPVKFRRNIVRTVGLPFFVKVNSLQRGLCSGIAKL